MADTIVLNRFASGNTDYIQKLNDNSDGLETAINAIYAQLGGQASAALDVPTGLRWIFDRLGLVGKGSYDFSVGSETNLTVAAGAYWNGTKLYVKSSSTALSLTGKAAGTYYLNLDGAGNPTISASADGTTTRQFAWDGSGITSAKALYIGVAILFSGADFAACLSSVARSRTYQALADRLEDIESGAFGGVQTITPGDSVTIDWSKGRKASLLLNRATTAITMENAPDGETCILFLVQDGTGGRAVTFGSEVIAGADLALPPVLSAGPNKEDDLGFIFRSSNNKFRFVSMSKGF